MLMVHRACQAALSKVLYANYLETVILSLQHFLLLLLECKEFNPHYHVTYIYFWFVFQHKLTLLYNKYYFSWNNMIRVFFLWKDGVHSPKTLKSRHLPSLTLLNNSFNKYLYFLSPY